MIFSKIFKYEKSTHMSIFGSERKRYNERQNHSTDASTYARKESEDRSMGF